MRKSMSKLMSEDEPEPNCPASHTCAAAASLDLMSCVCAEFCADVAYRRRNHMYLYCKASRAVPPFTPSQRWLGLFDVNVFAVFNQQRNCALRMQPSDQRPCRCSGQRRAHGVVVSSRPPVTAARSPRRPISAPRPREPDRGRCRSKRWWELVRVKLRSTPVAEAALDAVCAAT